MLKLVKGRQFRKGLFDYLICVGVIWDRRCVVTSRVCDNPVRLRKGNFVWGQLQFPVGKDIR